MFAEAFPNQGRRLVGGVDDEAVASAGGGRSVSGEEIHEKLSRDFNRRGLRADEVQRNRHDPGIFDFGAGGKLLKGEDD